MNQLVRKPIEGEILAPDATVRVIGKLHPFSGDRVQCELQAGLSIGEILSEAIGRVRPKSATRRDFVVEINGDAIFERNWDRVRPKAGTTVTFRQRMQNGGSTLTTVLGLAVAITALIAAPYLASFITIAGLPLLGTSLALAKGAIALGIVLAGTLAINALFPTRPSDAVGAGGVFNSIQGAQNQANPFGSVPVVLGRHRQSPVYTAKPVTQIVGDDQFLRLFFCLGYGPLQVSNIQIGETPIENYSDVEIEIKQGFVGDSAPTLYSNQFDEQQLAITIENAIDGPGLNGGNGPWSASVFTSVATDEISVDFTATKGINAKDPKGDDVTWPVTAGMRYRKVGDVAWQAETRVTFTRSFKPVRLGIDFSVDRGQYEVQTHKVTGAGNPDFTADTIVWSALRSIKQAKPISFPKPLALIALRIRATDQLSGIVDTLNCICTSLVAAFNGTIWVANTASQNPADLFRHVLQGPANARPVADSHLDLDSLEAWWTFCVANGFKFNQVITSAGSVYDKLADIAAAGRAVPTFIDGKWGVIWDQPDADIVQHFTPRNSWGFQGQRAYAQQPHGWRASFINEDNGFTEDERIVYDDGFDASNATLFEGIEFPGVTDPALIWKHGRFHIAQSRLRPETITLNTGWENLICTRGDRVKVTHDVLLIGLGSGRVKSVSGQVVALDEIVTLGSGKTYGLQFRLPGDIRSIERAVDASITAGEYSSLTLVGDLSSIEPGVLFAFGETSRESANYRIKSISPQQDLVATLTLVDDAPAISTADQGAIPAYDPNVSIPADPFTLPPRGLAYSLVINSLGYAVVRLSWQVSRAGNVIVYEVQQRDDGASGDWQGVGSVVPPSTSIDIPLVQAGTWSYRVRSDFSNGTVSSWTELDFLPLSVVANPLPDVTNLRDVFVGSISQLIWDEVVDFRTVQYQVSKGTVFATAQVLRVVSHPPFATQGDGTYWVTAIATPIAGLTVTSEIPAEITIATQGSVLVDNVIAEFDEAADHWPGTFTGGAVTDGTVIRTGSNGDFLGETDFLAEPDFLNAGGTGQVSGTYLIANSHVVQLTSPVACKVTITWEARGELVAANFLNVTDFLGQTDFLGFAATARVDVYPEVRTAQEQGAGFLARTDFLATDDFLFADSFTWGPWQRYETGYYVGLAFDAQMVLNTNDPQVIAEASAMTFMVDVPDRQDTYNLVLNAEPSSILFQPQSASAPAAFNGGPGESHVPIVQATVIQSGDFIPGDEVVVSDLSLNGLTIEVKNAGIPVARNVHLTVQGF